MTARYLAIAVGVLCLLSLQSHAQSTKPDATTFIGLQSVTIGERGTELLLRFDRPINHARSWISLIQDGRIVETVHFRLEAAPNVLFARIQTPAPGNYIVRWTVCPEGSDDRYEGEFPFTVGHVAASIARPTDGAVIVPAELGGASGLRISSPAVAEDATLLYIQGSCYIAGSAEAIRRLTAGLGKAAGMTAYSVDYRLAPEHPCPAAIEDTVAAHKALLERGLSPDRIVIGGDSSGGELALAALVALRDAGVVLPAAAFLISPWTDLTLAGASIRAKPDADRLLTERGLRAAAAHYLSGTPSNRADASPLYADLRGLPPTIIHAGSAEILVDDAARTAAALGSADVDVTLHVWAHLPHAHHVLRPNMPAAVNAINEIGTFLGARIAAASSKAPS
jgi:acetyl esterase/lipase